MATIKEIFDRQFDQVKFDAELCRRIVRFSQNFMTRNDDHSAFFGGVLLGVNPIRFLDSDREEWYEEVLDIDESLLVNDFKKATAINPTFKVSSDVFNYTPAYICHRLDKVNGIPAKLKEEAKVHAFMVLHYRFLTSLLVRRFRYPADPAVARATYSLLSGQYDIRRYGSWRALIEARSRDLISPNSIYRQALQSFSPDPKVIRIVTDTQSRIRELVKKIYAIYLDTLNSNARVATTSATMMTTDGEMILKDRKSGYGSYLRYAHEIIQSERSFVRDELLEVVSSAMRTMPVPLLRDTLIYMSRNYGRAQHKYLEEITEEALLYVFDYLQANRQLLGRTNDLSGLLARLRALLMASRSSDPTILKLRELTEKLVRNSVRTRNQPVIASVRTGTLLYLVLRTLTKQYYSN